MLALREKWSPKQRTPKDPIQPVRNSKKKHKTGASENFFWLNCKIPLNLEGVFLAKEVPLSNLIPWNHHSLTTTSSCMNLPCPLPVPSCIGSSQKAMIPAKHSLSHLAETVFGSSSSNSGIWDMTIRENIYAQLQLTPFRLPRRPQCCLSSQGLNGCRGFTAKICQVFIL